MAKKKLTKAEQLAQTPIEDFIKMPTAKLRGVEKTLRYGYNRRVQSFKRKNLISHAQISLEASLPSTGSRKSLGSVQSTKTKPTSSGNKNSFNRPDLAERNRLILEIARYAKFFNDETSSEAGIRRVNRAQDISIFGADKRGNPNYTMSNEERTRFWSLYEEFLNQDPTATSRYDSNRIKTMLGDIMINEEQSNVITDLFDNLEERLYLDKYENVIDEEGTIWNVLSGRGDNFPK